MTPDFTHATLGHTGLPVHRLGLSASYRPGKKVVFEPIDDGISSGGSTSRCDRSANQDAMSPSECHGLTLLGGIVGAGLGAAVGALFH